VRLIGPISLVILALGASPAHAATQLGQLQPPNEAPCTGSTTITVEVEPGTTPYRVPADGVITSWQTRTGAHGGTAALKVMRLENEAPEEYLVAAVDGPHPVAKETEPLFSGVRIPVQANDYIGLSANGIDCLFNATSAYKILTFKPDPPAGTEASPIGFSKNLASEILVTVEPDADRDQYGDETQDGCPSDPAVHATPCPRPNDNRTPKLRLSGKAVQNALKQRAVVVFAKADENVTLKASGSVSMPGAGFSLQPRSIEVNRNVEARIRLPISRSGVKKLKKALKKGQKPRATVRVVATDEFGNASKASLGVKLAKPSREKPRR
jgi:hypothetical protein